MLVTLVAMLLVIMPTDLYCILIHGEVGHKALYTSGTEPTGCSHK